MTLSSAAVGVAALGLAAGWQVTRYARGTDMAQETRDFVFSDYLFGKTNNRPIMMAAYPVSAINPEEDSVAVAGINLDWLSKIMANFSGRPGISALLIDSTGVVLAAPPDQASMIGRRHRTRKRSTPAAQGEPTGAGSPGTASWATQRISTRSERLRASKLCRTVSATTAGRATIARSGIRPAGSNLPGCWRNSARQADVVF